MRFAMMSTSLAMMWLLGSLICVANVQATSVRAWLDRDTVALDETLTLNVELEGGSSSAPPDFSALKKDFDLLGTSSNTSVSIINGQSSSKVLWAVGLQSRRAGVLTIPPLNIGGTSTQPLSLTVKAAAAGKVDANGKPVGDMLLELNAEPRAPYVQQQIRVTLKLYYAVNLTEGNLEDPHLDGVVVKKLGQDKNYQGNLNGRSYNILERHYALTAEKSGKLLLPAINFRGRAQDVNDLNSFFNRGRLVTVHSDAIELDVRPRRADTGTNAWLPAAALTLTADGVDTASTVHIGEPLTLNLHLKAQGLGFEQLPELILDAVDGAEVYPDKSATRTRDDGIWQYGERDRKFALVPTRAGKLKLPAVELRWWDTEHDRAEVASVPAREIDVLPAIGTTNVAPVISAVTTMPPSGADVQASATETAALVLAQTQLHTWRWLAIASLILWFLSMLGATIGFLRRRNIGLATLNSAASASTVDDTKPRSAFRSACVRNDINAAAHALLRWARLQQSTLRNLGELTPLLSDPSQREVLTQLERVRYGDGDSAGVAERMAAVFANGISFRHANVKKSESALLPELYPTRI